MGGPWLPYGRKDIENTLRVHNSLRDNPELPKFLTKKELRGGLCRDVDLLHHSQDPLRGLDRLHDSDGLAKHTRIALSSSLPAAEVDKLASSVQGVLRLVHHQGGEAAHGFVRCLRPTLRGIAEPNHTTTPLRQSIEDQWSVGSVVGPPRQSVSTKEIKKSNS